MTINILHGDNTGESRKALNTALDKLKENGIEVVYLDGAKCTYTELELVLNSDNLFFAQALVIEGLLSRPRGKIKDNLISLIAKYSGNKEVFLWDAREVAKSNISPFNKNAQITIYKTPVVIFQLLESLKPHNYSASHQLLIRCKDTLEPGFIFIMVTRHISSLLIAKSGDVSKLTPFMRSRLISQANVWNERELIRFHSELHRIDQTIKTGGSKLDYISQLDLLLARLLNYSLVS